MPEFDPGYLEPLRFRRVQEGEMNATIQDILVYLVYLVIVLAVANGNRDSNSFYMKDSLATTIVHGGLLCGRPDQDPCDPVDDLPQWTNPYTGNTGPNPYIDFMQVNEVNQFWIWMDQTLIPNVRVQNWYNGDPPYGLRGYLDDRVNRLIGYAVVRQVREKIGNCRAPPQMRDYVESCTGDLTIPLLEEDDRTYCLGWKPIIADDCVRMREFEFRSESDRKASPTSGIYRTYTGGGYELRMKGSIVDLVNTIQVLQNTSWIDNRTRAVITEFSVFNAQVNQFGVLKIIAEFVGGGLMPTFRIDVITLTRIFDFSGIITTIAEVLFVGATFYYLLNAVLMMKSMGARNYFKESWNVVDVLTIGLSIITIVLWAVKAFRVALFTQEIEKTGGNDYVAIDDAQQINKFYDYCCSMTAFTSMLKLCRLLSFQKAFRQIAATIKLCFIGLSTFIVEFIIVFGSFCCFFFFMLSSYLSNFKDPVHTVENTLAMAIGKFNFSSLKEASEFAAWIFFAFSIVVNMILINMMMAIINMAFEEIKGQKDTYQNKFEIIEYIKRSVREITGVKSAERELPVFRIDKPEGEEEIFLEEEQGDKPISVEFSDKTNQLLEYIEKTYLSGFVQADGQGKNILDKMRLAENTTKSKAILYGFDNIFAEGPTPTPSMFGGGVEEDDELLNLDDQLDLDDRSISDLSISNVDGMDIM